MNGRLLNELQELGLSDKEASVYLALLENGSSTATETAKSAKVNRATGYVVLESLQEKGLVAEIDEGKVKKFVANPPSSLRSLISQAENKIEYQKRLLEKTLPELESEYEKSDEGPIVRFFKGKENILNAAREFVMQPNSPKNEYVRLIFSRELLPNIPDSYLEENRAYRKNNTVKTFSLFANKEDAPNEFKSDDLNTRLPIDKKEYPVIADIEVFGDRVFIADYRDKYNAILIIDEAVATTMKTLHKLAVEGAKVVEKKGDEQK